MKKLYFGILLLLLPVICFGQGRFPFSNSAHLYSGSGSSYVEKYQAVYDEYEIKPHADTAIHFNDFVHSWDTAGFWDMTDLMYVFCVNNNDNAEIMMIDPDGIYNLSDGDTVSHTRYQGYTGDGNDYLDTYFDITNDTTNARPTDSIAVITYCLTDYENISYHFFGSGDYFSGETESAHGKPLCLLNTGQVVAADYNTSNGLFIFSKLVDTVSMYKNGSLIHEETVSQRDISFADENLYWLAINDGSGGSGFSQAQYGIMILIKGLNDTQASTASGIINNLFTDLGINEY
jgi:hypothetical protein